jgi:hypothetical protein
MKLFFNALPAFRYLLPHKIQRYFINDDLEEKIFPDNWWIRSDSP